MGQAEGRSRLRFGIVGKKICNTGLFCRLYVSCQELLLYFTLKRSHG